MFFRQREGARTDGSRIPAVKGVSAVRYRYISYKYSRKIGPDPLFQNVWDSFHSWAAPSAACWHPPTDVYETRETLSVLVELAGISEENIEVTLYNDLLVIEGDRQPLLGEKTSSCHQLGIKYGVFRSEVHLPFPVDQENVRADYKNGLLKITLRKIV